MSFSRYRNLLMVVWLDAATASSADQFAAVGQRLGTEVPRFSVLHWLTPNRAMPEPAVRRRLVEVARELRASIACTSVVLNGVGFWASALRATVNGMRLMSTNRVDLRVDHTLDEVAAWLPSVHTERTAVQLTTQTLRDAVDAALRQSGSGPSPGP